MNKPVVPLGGSSLHFERTGDGEASGRPQRPTLNAGPVARVVVVRSLDALADHLGAWDDLARNAAEPNPFHESWFIVAAMQAFGRGADLRFVLVYTDTSPGGLPQLCGVFPLERSRGAHAYLPGHLRLWTPAPSGLGTPLLRRGHEAVALEALHDWLRDDDDGSAVMAWNRIGSDGPVHAALTRLLGARSLRSWHARREEHALLLPRASAEAYVAEMFSPKGRRELRRIERRLAEHGPLQYRQLGSDDDVEVWIADFLALEASGWKGRNGSALGSTQPHRAFFVRAASEAARRGHLSMMALCAGGRPLAMRCAFNANEGAFAFRIAYDEAYARYSPGLLLEVEHARRFHDSRRSAWMDSCAAPGDFMADHLWPGRRTLVTSYTATGRRGGNASIRMLAVARWCRSRWNLVASQGFEPRTNGL